MKYAILLSILVLSSCKTSKQVSTETYTKTESSDKEIVDTVKYLNANRGYSNSSNSAKVVETEVEETEYITVLGKDSTLVIVPKKTKKTKTKIKVVESDTVDFVESRSDSTKIISTKTVDTTSETKNKLREKSKTSNSPLVRFGYLTLVLLIGVYIIVKKYFPSIFVKVIKSLKSIIK